MSQPQPTDICQHKNCGKTFYEHYADEHYCFSGISIHSKEWKQTFLHSEQAEQKERNMTDEGKQIVKLWKENVSLLEKLKDAEERVLKAEAQLGELLAIIHRDGGHYQAEHGTEKAVKDAVTKYWELRQQVENN